MRLNDLTGQFERRFVQIFEPEKPTHIIGFGMSGPGPNPQAVSVTTAKHCRPVGNGSTEEEALDDWYSQLPTGFDWLAWRARPEMVSEVDFDTKQKHWKVWSRFSVGNYDKKATQ